MFFGKKNCKNTIGTHHLDNYGYLHYSHIYSVKNVFCRRIFFCFEKTKLFFFNIDEDFCRTKFELKNVCMLNKHNVICLMKISSVWIKIYTFFRFIV